MEAAATVLAVGASQDAGADTSGAAARLAAMRLMIEGLVKELVRACSRSAGGRAPGGMEMVSRLCDTVRTGEAR